MFLPTSNSEEPILPKVKDTFEALYKFVGDQQDIWEFTTLTDLAVQFKLRERAAAASDSESFTSAIPGGTHPTIFMGAWDLAGRLYETVGDKDGRQRCLWASVQQILAIVEKVQQSPGAEAMWITEALQRRSHIHGEPELERKLKDRLRELQTMQINQMGRFQIDLRLGDIPEQVTRHFEALTLPDALRDFALLEKSPDPVDLQKMPRLPASKRR